MAQIENLVTRQANPAFDHIKNLVELDQLAEAIDRLEALSEFQKQASLLRRRLGQVDEETRKSL